jgi:uncharacterized membrane protein YccC
MDVLWTTIFFGGGVAILKAFVEGLRSIVPAPRPKWVIRGVTLVVGLAIGAAAAHQLHYAIYDGLLSGFLQVLASFGLYTWSAINRK